MTDIEHEQHDTAPPGTLAARTLSALRTARADAPPAPAEPGAVKTATTKTATDKTSATKTSAAEPATVKTATAKTSAAKTSATKTATAKTATAKTSATKTSATQSSATKTSAAKTSATKTAATDTKTADTREGAPRLSRQTAALLVALVVAAAAFAGVAAIVWWRAGHDGTRAAAGERDAAALAARLDVAALNTLDYRKPEAALTKWLAVSTGTVHDQFAQSAKSAASLIAQAKTSTAGTVLDAAVSSLDTRGRTATVLVSINVKRIPATGAATTSRNRYLATMKLVGGQWKISDLQIVEVQLA